LAEHNEPFSSFITKEATPMRVNFPPIKVVAGPKRTFVLREAAFVYEIIFKSLAMAVCWQFSDIITKIYLRSLFIQQTC
jgi:hypothetical protein